MRLASSDSECPQARPLMAIAMAKGNRVLNEIQNISISFGLWSRLSMARLPFNLDGSLHGLDTERHDSQAPEGEDDQHHHHLFGELLAVLPPEPEQCAQHERQIRPRRPFHQKYLFFLHFNGRIGEPFSAYPFGKHVQAFMEERGFVPKMAEKTVQGDK